MPISPKLSLAFNFSDKKSVYIYHFPHIICYILQPFNHPWCGPNHPKWLEELLRSLLCTLYNLLFISPRSKYSVGTLFLNPPNLSLSFISRGTVLIHKTDFTLCFVWVRYLGRHWYSKINDDRNIIDKFSFPSMVFWVITPYCLIGRNDISEENATIFRVQT
jgi:hypothetical protein